uniref:Outer capsid protein VP2 n=1 Tax=Ife virus TaxID=2547357 RepID=A0A482A5L8_9REOV|nr:VP2 [Ife virus]
MDEFAIACYDPQLNVKHPELTSYDVIVERNKDSGKENQLWLSVARQKVTVGGEFDRPGVGWTFEDHYIHFPDLFFDALRATSQGKSRLRVFDQSRYNQNLVPRKCMDSEYATKIETRCMFGRVMVESKYSEMSNVNYLINKKYEYCDHSYSDFFRDVFLRGHACFFYPMILGVRSGWTLTKRADGIIGSEYTHGGISPQQLQRMKHKGMRECIGYLKDNPNLDSECVWKHVNEVSRERADPEVVVKVSVTFDEFKEKLAKIVAGTGKVQVKKDIPQFMRNAYTLAALSYEIAGRISVYASDPAMRGIALVLERSVGNISTNAAKYCTTEVDKVQLLVAPIGRERWVPDSKPQPERGDERNIMIKVHFPPALSLGYYTPYEYLISDARVKVDEIKKLVKRFDEIRDTPHYIEVLQRKDPRSMFYLSGSKVMGQIATIECGAMVHHMELHFEEKKRSDWSPRVFCYPYNYLIWEERLLNQHPMVVGNFLPDNGQEMDELSFEMSTQIGKKRCIGTISRLMARSLFEILIEIFDRHFTHTRVAKPRILDLNSRFSKDTTPVTLCKLITNLYCRYTMLPEMGEAACERFQFCILEGTAEQRINLLASLDASWDIFSNVGVVHYDAVIRWNLLLLSFLLMPTVKELDVTILFAMVPFTDTVLPIPFTTRNFTDDLTISGFLTFLQFYPKKAALKREIKGEELALIRSALKRNLGVRITLEDNPWMNGIREHLEAWMGCICGGVSEVFTVIRPIRVPKPGFLVIHLCSRHTDISYARWRLGRRYLDYDGCRGEVWIRIPELSIKVDGEVKVKVLKRMTRGFTFDVVIVRSQDATFGNDHLGVKLMN